MDQYHKELLREYRMDIRAAIEISISHVVNYLQSKTILSPDMTQCILCEPPPSKQVYKLLDLLPTRGPRAFETFYDATRAYELWEAADILKPDKKPHETNVGPLVSRRRNLHHPNPPATTQNHIVQGMDLNRVVNYMGMYANELEYGWNSNYQFQHNGSFHSTRAVQQSQAFFHSGPMCQQLPCENRMFFCHGGQEQVATLDSPSCDSPEDDLTKDLIGEFKIPLNINDLITLAALEEKAELVDRKAHDIVTQMASKAKEYIEAKTVEDDGMAPEDAKRQYISMSKPQNPHSDFRFFQVWGLSKPMLEGPSILAFNSNTIKILDFVTKEDKFQRSLESLIKCKLSRDYTYSVILEFQDQTVIVLSLQHEKIYQELRNLRTPKRP